MLVEYRSRIEDSTRWSRFAFRPGDIVISAPSKSGMTWTQTLVALLLFEGGPWPGTVAELSPWLDMTIRSEDRVFAILEQQRHRRFIKTHTPLDGVPVRQDVTYVCVGRDPRDAVVSMTHHLTNLDHDRAAELSSALGGDFETMPPPPGGFPPDFFLRGWLDDGADAPWPLPDLLHHHVVAWKMRHLPHVELFHFADYSRDLSTEVERLARHLQVETDASRTARIVDLASIESARRRAETLAPDAHLGAWKDPSAFFRSGRRGQWQDLLSGDDVATYEAMVAEMLEPESNHWVHHGWGG